MLAVDIDISFKRFQGWILRLALAGLRFFFGELCSNLTLSDHKIDF